MELISELNELKGGLSYNPGTDTVGCKSAHKNTSPLEVPDFLGLFHSLVLCPLSL